VTAHVEHAALEYGKQPDRPSADDRDIAAMRLALHRVTLAARRAGASFLGKARSPFTQADLAVNRVLDIQGLVHASL